MLETMRKSTLDTIGLGATLDFFRQGRFPVNSEELVDKVFGPAGRRGAMVVSGAAGIVGAGKVMQFGARLEPFGVPVVALDFAGAADGIGRQYPGLVRSFGPERADRIMSNVIRLSYDGVRLPRTLQGLGPRVLLEAVPEKLEIKRAHYRIFREAFPGIEIRSVTSGFPASKLGVGIAHPAFPHESNKVFEIVEAEPSDFTRLLWALGLMPIPVGDHWSFVLDVLFCGLTLAGTGFHEASNMPYWKIDKYVRRLLGPNPFRAHDAIGAKGATFLTWSCLHHLAEHYGPLFRPGPELEAKVHDGLNWYPPDHFRPVVDWGMDKGEEEEFRVRILGPIIQMAALMLHENRALPTHMNRIGELCAQFRRGILAVIRELGPDEAIRLVESFHSLEPEAALSPWHAEVFKAMDSQEWNQLYVNAEHDGRIGLITLGREAYNRDMDRELNRAMDWLLSKGIERVILSGDFHLAGQLVGADTAEFFDCLDDQAQGEAICLAWTGTARRLHSDFRVSVGFIGGKRCLGGMLELMSHCHFVVAVEEALLGMPEVTLPVVPGMDGCHWLFRKSPSELWPKIRSLLLGGRPRKAQDTVGWLTDHVGPMDEAMAMAWRLAAGDEAVVLRRTLETGPLRGVFDGDAEDEPRQGPNEAKAALVQAILDSCSVGLGESLSVQSRHSAGFMAGKACRQGAVGAERQRIMAV